MIGRPLVRLASVTSTQEIAFSLAERGAVEGTTVRAQYQSSGRGRAGRAWTTEPGEALLFSILLRPAVPADKLSPLSLVIGEAIASVLSDELGIRPAVKWPNDILIDGRKACGILIQSRAAGPDRSLTVVAGIGLNVSSPGDRLPPTATSLAAATGAAVDDEALFRSLLAAIEARYRDFLTGSANRSVSRVNDLLWLHGEQVSIEDADRVLTGRLEGVADDGALILRTADGLQHVVSGELTRGPRAVPR